MTDNCGYLPGEWPPGLGCDHNSVRNAAIASLADALCDLQCKADEIRCTTSIVEADWNNLWLNTGCPSVPCGSVVIVHDGGGGLVDAQAWNGTAWTSLLAVTVTDKEFRVGVDANFVDNANPTVAELNALFAGGPSNHALVYNVPNNSWHYTDDAGVSWTAVQIQLNATAQRFNIASGNIGYHTPLKTFITRQSLATYQIGDLVSLFSDVGYGIVQFGTGSPCGDKVVVKVKVTGAGQNYTLDYGEQSNGMSTTFAHSFVATASGKVTVQIQYQFGAFCDGFIWNWFSRWSLFESVGA